jgi:hypothetical protein
MKKQFKANVESGNPFAATHWLKYLVGVVPLAGVILYFLVLFSGCSKQDSQKQVNTTSLNQTGATNLATDDMFLVAYQNATDSKNVNAKNAPEFTWATFLELLQVRAATAKYLDFDKAMKDGYADINTFMPHMGYHYLKAAYLDDKFEVTRPELLVYRKDKNGKMLLNAVEYAVPRDDKYPDGVPKVFGFTGTSDKWEYNAMFNVWTLHAWVWYYNPRGVFAPYNPLVVP